MRETFVVNLHKEDFDVYIGRKGKGQDGYFGNPFHNGTRSENIAAFRKYFYDRLKTDPIFNRRVRSLKGKILGCFCKPRACHGDVIAEYLNGLPDEEPVRLAVVGSRGFSNYEFLKEILQWYDIRQIISGGAKGADQLAAQFASEHDIPLKEFLPDWNRYGRSAGYRRNEQIVEACDEVVAFWDGQSRGTKHTINIAEEKSKPVAIYWPRASVNPSIPHDEISML
jgi:hypothetical protein